MKTFKISFMALLFMLLFLQLSSSHAAKTVGVQADKTKCELEFSLKSWSVFYKSGRGAGVIRCDNGQEANVHIRTHGGGITFGKSEILDGKGQFSGVYDIAKLFGGYV